MILSLYLQERWPHLARCHGPSAGSRRLAPAGSASPCFLPPGTPCTFQGAVASAYSRLRASPMSASRHPATGETRSSETLSRMRNDSWCLLTPRAGRCETWTVRTGWCPNSGAAGPLSAHVGDQVATDEHQVTTYEASTLMPRRCLDGSRVAHGSASAQSCSCPASAVVVS